MIEIQNPNTGKKERIKPTSITEVNKCIDQLKSNTTWGTFSIKKRITYLKKFNALLKKNKHTLQHALSMETGKPRWESHGEITSAINKLKATLLAHEMRCHYPIQSNQNKQIQTILKPLGCIAIIGPFNFPIHIPNGQILPALLTGNTVIFKSSEYTIKTTRIIESLWSKTFEDTPSPLRFVYGGKGIGDHLVKHNDTDAIFFTGSTSVGRAIELECIKQRKLCALEMGGNNALIIEDASPKIINHLIMSCFITAGQRCSCARRIIINKKHESIIEQWINAINQLTIKNYPNKGAFMGPVVIPSIKKLLLEKKFKTMETLLSSKDIGPGGLISPRLELTTTPIDNELFGPIAFVTFSNSLEESIQMANASNFGLSCSIYTRSKKKYNHAMQQINSGVINWNTPSTGASGIAPFGGLKHSGNHRPGGFSMIDHCYTPIATSQSTIISSLDLEPNV